ncbi:MAG: zf-TFIIB domain-containing protein [Allosphingosinicella sp.]|uniref:TFIIB-type zinc ribbon-containing protein n=1 Tax=Allosphingosinicella sp. TaxID=2823234 RepID=UPI00392BAE85
MSNPVKATACPVDGAALLMTERSGIEIDYCPACRGVWLDRGELDKIIERSSERAASPPPSAQDVPWTGNARREYAGDRQGHGYRKRKKSFLEELFD